MESIWTQTAQMPRFQPLNTDLKTDVLVIGGGIAGILCTWMLTQAGVDCVLTEANRLCSAITRNTTAKITAQHGLIYDKLIRTYGLETAHLYLSANQSAVERYRTMCQSIDCDFQEQPSIVYTLNNRKAIEKEHAALEKLGFDARLLSQLPLPFPVAGAIQFPGQAQFHPLKFLAAIAKDLLVFEQTKVLALAPGRAVTNNGTIRAEKIIVATHFPFLNKHGSFFLKQYQHRSYVLALRNAPTPEGMYVDEADTGLSFRSWKDLLLLGGGGHRTGKQGGSWTELDHFVQTHFPCAQVAARWAAQDCMTLDGMPYIGQYSARTPTLYTATGFNKWGMTSSMVAAELLTDLILDRDTPFAPVFSPSRTMMHPQLALNAVEAAVNLLTPTVPRCPHMGCALKYNREEHSWDCPCHGSRFGEDGTLLDNPAEGALPDGDSKFRRR